MERYQVVGETHMKIGFQTIVWWPFRDPLEYRLEVISAAGYQGVEFKERPDELPTIEKLLKLLKKYNLEMLGLAGGSLHSRMEYCKSCRPPYLYIEDWDKDIAKEAVDQEFTLAIHPHVFKPTHSFEGAKRLLKKDPRLKFLPDTAHLTVGGDKPIKVIRYFEEKMDRIAAVHLKDWTDEFGRTVHRYARGFTELGEGIVNLKATIESLEKIGYEGWVIVEQDYTKGDPAVSVFNCAKWLSRETNLLPTPDEKPPVRPLRRVAKKGSTKGEPAFLKTMASAGWQDVASCYESIARAFFELCKLNVANGEMVTLWTCSPAQRLISLVATKPDVEVKDQNVLDCREVLTGDTIEEQTIQKFDLDNPEYLERFGWPKLLEKMGWGWMTSIPVFNPWNPNHVRLVVNILHNKGMLPVSDKKLNDLAVSIGYSTSYALDEESFTLAERVNALASESKRLEEFTQGLPNLVEEAMDCEAACIYMRHPSGDDIKPVIYTTGQTSVDKRIKRWYSKRERSKAISDILKGKKKFVKPRDWWQIVEADDQTDLRERRACTAAPFVGADSSFLGFVSCSGRRHRGSISDTRDFVFSDDDDAILEAIAQAAVPHIEVLKAREGLQEALDREKEAGERMHTSLLVLGHETQQLNYGLEQLRMRYLRDKGRLLKLIELEYGPELVCQHIMNYFKQINMLFDQVRILVEEELPKPKKEYFWSHRELLRKWADIYYQDARHKKLQFEIQPTYEEDESRPQVYGNKMLLEQVLYNLVKNAVKYCYMGTKIRMDCRKRSLSNRKAPHILNVTDFGRNFECEDLFGLNKRGENVEGIPGIGVGLYNARRIAIAHNGKIECKQKKVSNYNVPLVVPYLDPKFERKDTELVPLLETELKRLKLSGKHEEIVARSKKWGGGLPLYKPVDDELLYLIIKPTWEVTFEVTIPAKGTKR